MTIPNYEPFKQTMLKLLTSMIERWGVVCMKKSCVLLLLCALAAPLHSNAANGEVFEGCRTEYPHPGVVKDGEAIRSSAQR